MALVPIASDEELGEIQSLLVEDLHQFFRGSTFGWRVEFREQHITFGEPKSYSQIRLMIRFESIAAVLVIDKVMLKQRPGISEVKYDYCDPAFPDNLKKDAVELLEEAEWMFNSYQ